VAGGEVGFGGDEDKGGGDVSAGVAGAQALRRMPKYTATIKIHLIFGMEAFLFMIYTA